MAELEFREGFESPKDVHELLVRAREIISDESRWVQQNYVTRGDEHDAPAMCTNVRVCAVGAVHVARFDGAAVRMYVGRYADDSIPELPPGGVDMDADPMVAEATDLLNDAARRVGEENGIWTSSIISLNDKDLYTLADSDVHKQFQSGNPQESAAAFKRMRVEHLARVQRAFDLAIRGSGQGHGLVIPTTRRDHR